MNRRLLTLLLVLAPLIPQGLHASPAVAPPALVALESCHLAVPQFPLRIAAKCTELAVPENPDDPDGPSIQLSIAVLPATSRASAPDPLVFITGGPGQSALDSYVSVGPAFSRINRSRDIVLVDQRGTGASNALRCTTPDDFNELNASPDQRRAWLADCLAALPGDPRYYTTSVAVRDLDAVRVALGYEHVNLYGISYGTRVAQAYARRFPDRTRSVILDGVVPMDLALGPDISLDAQRALEMLFDRCAANPACAERFPTLRDSFARIQRQLRDAPVQLVLADPVTAELTESVFTEEYFSGIVRMFSYAPETVALLPLLIDHAASTGDFAPLAAQTLLVLQELGDSIATGMHNAIVCTEDLPFIDDGDAMRARLGETYLGANTLEYLVEACELWPRGIIDDDFKQPWTSDIPTLVLSGEADPVTPPSNGEHVIETLSSAKHIVGPGQGHGLSLRGCVPRLMAEFVEAADPTAIDAECVAHLRPSPFFLRFTGPNP